MASLYKNIQLLLESLKAPFMVLHFSCYMLMTFLMMLSVTLLSILLMILLPILSVIRHLICGNNLNWHWFESALLIWKWMGLFLRKNNLLRCWGWPSLLNWIVVLALSLLLKLPQRKLELKFVLWSFFLLRLLCVSVNLPYAHVWNTIVTSGLVPLVASWNCETNYKNE